MGIRKIVCGLKYDSVKNSSYVCTYDGFNGPVKPIEHDLVFDNAHNCINESSSTHWKVESDTTEYVGCVVSKHNTTIQVMSDVWDSAIEVVVYDAATVSFKSVIVSNFTLNNFTVIEVDATQEVRENYKIWLQIKQHEKSIKYYEKQLEKLLEEKATPDKGKWVKVVKGRKVPVGTKGLVFWTGYDSYNNRKLGIATTNRKVNNKYADVVWVAAYNVVVDNQPTF